MTSYDEEEKRSWKGVWISFALTVIAIIALVWLMASGCQSVRPFTQQVDSNDYEYQK
jgi:hypothetical protein